MSFLRLTFCALTLCALVHSRNPDLIADLDKVKRLDREVYDYFPISYGHYGHAGYFTTPSARMGCAGIVGGGYSHVPPYGNINAVVQPLERLEISASYRIFDGIPDPVLSPFGFGDFADKGANFKIAFLMPEESHYRLPGFAFGWEDFMGTRQFESQYLVFTQVFREQGVEVTLGYGFERLAGFFGGVLWMPFRRGGNCWLEPITLLAEYDPTDYEDPRKEPHPRARHKTSPFNVGMKVRLWDCLDISVSSTRGEKLALSALLFSNLGHTRGLLPKANDPPIYRGPINHEPVGCHRQPPQFLGELFWTLENQGFCLHTVDLAWDGCHRKRLRLSLVNLNYRSEECVRRRLEGILSALVPEDWFEVVVAVEADGVESHEYRFHVPHLLAHQECRLSPYELSLLSPRCEPTPLKGARRVFRKGLPALNWNLGPRWRTFFGSARGKFKYTLGASLSVNGVLADWLSYSLVSTKTFYSTLKNCRDVDMLNPSQIVNMRSDLCRYLDNHQVFLEEGYLQLGHHLGQGWYGRVAGGYFELMYGGLGMEALYFPSCSDWAFGVEAAALWKRGRKGLGFLSEIRRLDGFQPTYESFQPWQAFINVYYHCRPLETDFRLSLGQFLARDKGVMFEASRYFSNGFRLYLWYTHTDGKDFINGKRYHDKGVGFSLPVDFFLTHSCRDFWGYGMSAWLRDVGVRVEPGRRLYDTLAQERY